MVAGDDAMTTRNDDAMMQVAVPYWYYVRRLGKRIIRYSKMMAHDEENSANVSNDHLPIFSNRVALLLLRFLYCFLFYRPSPEGSTEGLLRLAWYICSFFFFFRISHCCCCGVSLAAVVTVDCGAKQSITNGWCKMKI